MHGTPFLLGPDEIAALQKLREAAASKPVDMPPLMERIKTPAGKAAHMRQMTAQTVELPFGYAVTFSIEFNHPGGRIARHMSMSSPAAGRVPRPEALWMVAGHLGFTGLTAIENAEEDFKGGDFVIWPEELQGHGTAINAVQFFSATQAAAARA